MARGPTLPLSLPRRWMGDLLDASRRVPLVPFERRMNLADLIMARRAVANAPGWSAIFVKAFATVAARRPELRRCYLPYPWPRLYEHPYSIATVAFERQWHGEPAVFFGQISAPEQMALADIATEIRRLKTAPLETVRPFRRLIRFTRLPRIIRRNLWSCALNLIGETRAATFGTFGLSVTAAHGASATQLVSPLTVTLCYGPFDPRGNLDVRITFDHRVLDGVPICRALAELEDVLHDEIRLELQRVAASPRASITSVYDESADDMSSHLG